MPILCTNKSSLTSKRVRRDSAFARTMCYANLLASASKIASAVYRQLKPEQKVKGLYRQLTGKVMQRLKDGEDIAKSAGEHSCRLFTATVFRKKQFKKKKESSTCICRSIACKLVCK